VLRRLEQRLEAERRHTDRQVQRLERRLEEVACASSAGGRWAELQGYVDGLAETVQNLVRGNDDGSVRCMPMAPASSGGASGDVGNGAVLEELKQRSLAAQAQASEFERRLHDLSARLMHIERGLDSFADLRDTREQVGELAKMVRHVCEVQRQVADAEEQRQHCLAAASPLHGDMLSDMPLHMGRLSDQTADIEGRLANIEHRLKSTAPLQDLQCLHDELAGLGERVQMAERGLGGDAAAGVASVADRGSVRTPLWEVEGSLRSETVVSEDPLRDLGEQLEALRGDFESQAAIVQDQIVDLGTRLQDAEHGLQDVASVQEVRQEMSQVNEQVLRLALRTQRASRAPGIVEEELRALRSEFGHVNEEVGGLWVRVEGAECGLESMSEALNRVCDELAELRSRLGRMPAAMNGEWDGQETVGEHTAGGSGTCDAVEGRCDDQPGFDMGGVADGHDSSGGPPLRCKVQEVERGLESMAEVVWDLRKQVRGLRQRSGAPHVERGEPADNGMGSEHMGDGEVRHVVHGGGKAHAPRSGHSNCFGIDIES